MLQNCSRAWRGGAMILMTAFTVLLSLVTLEPPIQAEAIGLPTEDNVTSDSEPNSDVNGDSDESKVAQRMLVEGLRIESNGVSMEPREVLDGLSNNLTIDPDNAKLLLARGWVLIELRAYADAKADLERVLELKPAGQLATAASHGLAIILATAPDESLRDGKRAIELAKKSAISFDRPSVESLMALAAAYAESDEFTRAVETQREAIRLATDDRVEKLREHLALYEAGKPQRAPASSFVKVAPIDLVGRVVDESGKPLAGVTVDVWTWHGGNETKTDADGHFLLTGFEANEALEVEFRLAGYGPRLFIEQPAGTLAWTITMKNDTYLEGRVLGPDGKGVPQAKVRAKRGPFENPQGTIGEVWTETIADDEGHYRLYLEPDTYEMQLRVPKVGIARHEGVAVNAGEQLEADIPLQPGPTFQAIVLDSATNEPVDGIRLWHWMQPGIEGISNAEGYLTIENMLPGEFEFIVSAANEERPHEIAGEYARWWSPAAIHEHERLETPSGTFQRNLDSLTFDIREKMSLVKVFVERCVTIHGRVVDPEGNPVAGATVAPAKTGSGNSLTGDTRYSYATKDDGTFEMRLPASGEAQYNLITHDGKYNEWRRWANGIGELLKTKPGETLNDVELWLTKPCIVRGKVVDANGKPVADHQVRAHSADKFESRYYDPTTKTNAEGEFELAFVRPGDHYIQTEPFWLEAEQGPPTGWRLVTTSPDTPMEGIELQGNSR